MSGFTTLRRPVLATGASCLGLAPLGAGIPASDSVFARGGK
ncbi:MAG: hypothetical protein ACJ8H8_14135 [Geminicoccaceae bacterium]